jgi:hypothetical protein
MTLVRGAAPCRDEQILSHVPFKRYFDDILVPNMVIVITVAAPCTVSCHFDAGRLGALLGGLPIAIALDLVPARLTQLQEAAFTKQIPQLFWASDEREDVTLLAAYITGSARNDSSCL